MEGLRVGATETVVKEGKALRCGEGRQSGVAVYLLQVPRLLPQLSLRGVVEWRVVRGEW